MEEEGRVQLLVSAMGKRPEELAEEIHLESDAILISQGEHWEYRELDYKGYRIRYFAMAERGVGLSRNNALMRADHEIILFADEDIVYRKGYGGRVEQAFCEHPEADVLLFNVKASAGRETYDIKTYGRVRWYNCGRYPAYSFAARTEEVQRLDITFSLLFGGGAKYSNGEDSLFLLSCIRKGLKVYRVPVTLGEERERESTWFKGYNRKFFFDRGVLYHYLYGILRKPAALRFLLAHKDEVCKKYTWREAYTIMKDGMKSVKEGKFH
jgi:glycosyltransferase involved in cell wall biosynthesis